MALAVCPVFAELCIDSRWRGQSEEDRMYSANIAWSNLTKPVVTEAELDAT